MHNPRITILFLAVALLGNGCAHQLTGSQGDADIQGNPGASGVMARPAYAELSKGSPAPPKDRRYHLPEARERVLTIFLGSQTFEYTEDGQVLLSGKVSSGVPADPTPVGDFRVLSKVLNKKSGKYKNFLNQPTPMPYSLQFIGNYYIHEGWVSGHPESPGCVYLNYADARLLYHRMRVGDRVQVKGEGVARPAVTQPQTSQPSAI